MHIRQALTLALIAMPPVCAMAQSVVELPGVHAAADAGCVEPARSASAAPTAAASQGSNAASPALSYGCLNRMMAADPVASNPQIDADVSKRPTNSLGLYNASGLQNRMGQNLGISVHPYRPQVSYPTPLVPPAR